MIFWKPTGLNGVRIFLSFAWIFGLVFLGIGIWFGEQSVRLVAGSEHHFGRIVRYEVTHDEKRICFHPIVHVLEKPGLLQSGMEIRSTSCSQNPDADMGNLVPVLIPYDGSEPEVATFGDLWIIPMVFGMIGLAWLLIGVIPVLLIWKRKRRLARLELYAPCYTIDKIRLERNGILSFNGQCPFQIVLEMNLDGKMVPFHSHNLWLQNPSDIVGPVLLYVDPRNPKLYAFAVDYRS